MSIPRFELAVAAGGRRALMGEPAALAPRPGGEAVIGEVSAAAEAFGVAPGMRLGEALARCPRLELVAPDPAGVAESWERALSALEAIGAAVETGRPGMACFDAGALLRLHGGSLRSVTAAARRALTGAGVRIGAAPSRFCAMAAARRARAGGRRRGEEIVEGGVEGARRYLSRLPVSLLNLRERTAGLPSPLERLGITSLGQVAALPRANLADRFGPPGLLAHDLASGRDEPLRPRRPTERVVESLELPEAGSGAQLERALALLVERLLARSERRGRSLRAVTLSALLVEGGTWQEQVTFREALDDAERMRLALALRLARLPAPAHTLRLAVDRFGPPRADQRALLADDEIEAARQARLREGIRQARSSAGPDAALRALAVDPGSRVPERRYVLAPYEEDPRR